MGFGSLSFVFAQGDTTYFLNEQNQFAREEVAKTKWTRIQRGKGKWEIQQATKDQRDWKVVEQYQIQTHDGIMYEEGPIDGTTTTRKLKYKLIPSAKGGYEVVTFYPFSVSQGHSSQFFPLRKEGIWTTSDSLGGRKTQENFYVGGSLTKENFYLANGRLLENVYTFADEDVELDFKGGFAGFIASEIRYPKAAIENGIKGKVFVSFFVSDSGEVLGESILRGIGYGCDEEVIRVLRLTQGKWKPGKVKGKPVHMKMVVPVVFK